MCASENLFRRNERPFFQARRTNDALAALAGKQHLVIYCGAGVTIDRTGLNWGGLLSAVFVRPDNAPTYPNEADVEALLKSSDALRLASVLVKYRMYESGNLADLATDVTPRMQSALYKRNVWQSGRLARNVALLAVAAASLRRNVTVVTTNYDVHIETQLKIEIDRMKSRGLASEVGFRVRAAGNKKIIAKQPSHPADSYIDVLYLHGRVAESGPPSGRLVFSELDYAESRGHSFAALSGLLSQADCGVLILGSSLVDPPLIEALALTRRDPAPDPPSRYVIMSIESLGVTNLPAPHAERLIEHHRTRAASLETALLTPDFKYQIAQFCEELMLCVTSGVDPGSYAVSEHQFGSKLQAWWSNWQRRNVATDPDRMFEAIETALGEIRRFIRNASTTEDSGDADEIFRLEVWVGDEPADRRRLVQWGHSAGPIRDRTALRYADLEVQSSSASVRSFTEGRPRHLDASELFSSRDIGPQRWNSYLSVPIYVPVKDGRVPVGVVTLMSTKPKADSVLPLASTKQMELLIRQIIQFGRLVLANDPGS